MEFDVTIEIPAGSRNKYGVTRPDASSSIGGCSPRPATPPTTDSSRTLGEDGDPLDALVLIEDPTFPGCLIRCRALGMFRMKDEAGGDDK